MTDPIACVEASVAEVSPRTRWIFVEVTTRAGLRGCGEATLLGREEQVLAALEHVSRSALQAGDASPATLPAAHVLRDLPHSAAWSAMDQALWDVRARREGCPLVDLLGPRQRDAIPLYANINRRTTDRTPTGFAATAREAMAAGYSAFKIAPLDEVQPNCDLEAFDVALERISAVRGVVGDARLMVDCHWRLDERSAAWFIEAVTPFQLHWVECPLVEDPANLPALRRLRSLANERGMRLAGCEENIGRQGFAPFLEAGAYDTMMPDAKYAGGLREMLDLSSLFAKHGVAFSPHNPTGPICDAASLHVASAAANFDCLEVQFQETPWFDDLQLEPLTRNEGTAPVPGGAGLGTTLDPEALRRCRKQYWRAP